MLESVATKRETPSRAALPTRLGVADAGVLHWSLRIACSAVSNPGYPVKISVIQAGCVRRMALTTVNPSPGFPMFRSEISTSNVLV